MTRNNDVNSIMDKFIISSPTIIIFNFIIQTQMMCLILLIHLSYYILANRIAVLKNLITDDTDFLYRHETELASVIISPASRPRL